MAHVQETEQLLRQLMSPDNTLRAQGEATFSSWRESNPEALVLSLLHIVRFSTDATMKPFALITLRPLLVKEGQTVWEKLSQDTKNTIKRELLNGTEQEPEESNRFKFCDAATDLAAIIVQSGGWPELLPLMFSWTKSPLENSREMSLIMFSALSRILMSQLAGHIATLGDVLVAGLSDAQSLKVRVAALSATCNFLSEIPDQQQRKSFQQLIPLMLEVVNSTISAKAEEQAQEALGFFMTLAETTPTFLRPHINTVVDIMFGITIAQHLQEDTRHSALEVLLTLAEQDSKTIRKIPTFLPRLIPILFSMMLTIEEDPEWGDNLDGEDDEDFNSYDIAEESIDRVSISIGGRLLVPEMFKIIPGLLQNASDWKQRFCGLMALSVMGEGCIKQMIPHLASVLGYVMPLFVDPHPRVRWAACNAIGQFSTDFGPKFQSLYHAQAVPALIATMDDINNPRVQMHASAAVINFCEECKPATLEPYLDALLTKMVMMIQSPKMRVQEQAVTVVASIAECAENHFLKYYDSFVNFLKNVLRAPLTKENTKLRGKSVECISLIGEAVGKEKFFADAKEIMQLMMATQGNLAADDPQIEYFQQAWARICTILGKDFVPFLSFVMPPLLHQAGIKPDIKVEDASVPSVVEDEEGWDRFEYGDQRISINAASLEEKSSACTQLNCYATELEETFFPYVEPVATLLIPLQKFIYNVGVRMAAVSIMPSLINSAILHLKAQPGAAPGSEMLYARAMFEKIFAVLSKAILQEPEVDNEAIMIQAWNESLELLGSNSLTKEMLDSSLEVIKKVFEKRQERGDEIAAKYSDPEHPERAEEEAEALDEEESMETDLLQQLADIVGRLIKYHNGPFVLHYFPSIAETVFAMIQPNRPPTERQAAICIFDDIAEFGGVEGSSYFPQYLPAVLQYVNDPDPALRQSCAYGLGVASRNPVFAPYANDALTRLTAVVQHAEARDEDNLPATENAISAFGQICANQSQQIDLSQALPLWLSWLPVSEDSVESKITYNTLCGFIESGNQHLLGPGLANVPKIIQVFGSAIGTELVDAPLTLRMVNIIKHTQTQIPSAVLTQAWATLPAEAQQNLTKALSA